MRIAFYLFLFRLAFPAIAGYTLAVFARRRCSRYLKQRFGFFAKTSSPGNPLWIHCASVGETSSALPLAAAWKERHGDDVVITSNTITSAHWLRSRAADTIRHYYLPLDYPSACKRFLDAVQPRCALVIETEIWLNLFRACRHRNVPVYLLSARLSKKTCTRASFLRGYYVHSFKEIKHIYARSENDKNVYIRLGAARAKVSVAGNLKYAAGPPPQVPQSLVSRDYLLAASTHHDEELIVAEALRDAEMKKLLVIVPRHPERGAAIQKQLLRRGFNGVRLRSQNQVPEDDTTIYVADTLGELPAWIAHADLVFTGGSLVNKGGHNVLEPAALGTPQLTGPHTENFHDEVTRLKAVNGIRIVSDRRQLSAAFRNTFTMPESFCAMAENARKYFREQENPLDKYLDIVSEISAETKPAAMPQTDLR